MNVILYSTGCPRCEILKLRLAQTGVRYEEVNDMNVMLSLGIKEVPYLSVDGNFLDFRDAIKWLSTLEEAE